MIKLYDYIESKDWRRKLHNLLLSSSIKRLETFLENELKAGREIKPHLENVFRAINLCPPSCKVVILGQDPYPAPGVADGLAFSCQNVGPLPPSLKNIFNEIIRSYGMKDKWVATKGDLTPWADQGVLLLNTILTCGDSPLSHADQGWELITRRILEIVVNDPEPKVFLAFGNKAMEFMSQFDQRNHVLYHTTHPSPLSVHRGFDGCDHFRRANRFLHNNDRSIVNWGIVFEEKETSRISHITKD